MNEAKILISPSINDKILLIDTIDKCLSLVNINDIDIKDIIYRITNIYNFNNLKYIDCNSNIIDTNLMFLTNDCVATIMSNAKSGCIQDLDILKIQMFVYASPWLDMDEYLKYLYYLYE